MTWTVLVVGFVFVMMTMLRWFEQVTEAVEMKWWGKVTAVVAAPFIVWFYPSRTTAGRPTGVAHHEPVRGFGLAPRDEAMVEAGAKESAPPGTPQEFLGMPKIPEKKANRPGVDADKLAKLRQKMREQGMLPPEE
jgi:hypothetical protein